MSREEGGLGEQMEVVICCHVDLLSAVLVGVDGWQKHKIDKE